MAWLESLWHFVFGWPSVAILIGAAATAIAILEPKQFDAITDLRKWAIVVAVIAFSFTAIAGKYYDDGLAEKKRQWDAALVKETERGEQAGTDAAATVGPITTDRSLFRSDPFNRDRGKPPVR